MNKILLTGSSGFLGRQIIEVIGAGQIKTLSRHGADYNLNLIDTIPAFESKFETVIHAAGKAHSVPKSQAQRDAFFDVNLKGTQNLLNGIDGSPGLPKSFIYISTVAVYGKETGVLINEDALLLANDAYGMSKIQAEELVQSWCKKNNVTCTILRLPLIAGTNPPGNLNAMINGIKKGYYFNIAGGHAKKSMVLANDVAAIILKAANTGGIFNLTDGCHPSFYELSKLIAAQLNRPIPHNIPYLLAKVLALTGDVIGEKSPINSIKLKKIISDLTFDDNRARTMLGWAPASVLSSFKI